MDKKIFSRLEDLHTELACSIDALDIIERSIAESIEPINAADALYSIISLQKRIVEDIDSCLLEARK